MQQENQITFQNFNQPANVDHLANQIRQHVSARRLTANIGQINEYLRQFIEAISD